MPLNQFVKSLNEILSSAKLCISISWNASALFTVIRMVSKVITPLCSLVFSYLSKNLIDELTLTQSRNVIFYTVLLIILFSMIGLIMRKISDYSENIHDALIGKQIQTLIMDQMKTADIKFFDDPDYLNSYSFASTNVYAVTNLLWNIIDLVASIISFAIIIVSIAKLNIIYGLLVLLTALPTAVASRYFTQKGFDLTREQLTLERKKNYLVNLISDRDYAKEIRVLNVGDFLSKRYHKLWTLTFIKQKKLLSKRTLVSFILELPQLGAYVYILLSISLAIKNQASTLGDLTFWISIYSQFQMHINLIVGNSIGIYEKRMHASEFNKFESSLTARMKDGKKEITCVESIEFRNVEFKYPGSKKKVLNSMSFSIKKGQFVILVGENGSGKSTIVKLLLRLYDPSDGEILINGVNIKEYQLNSLRSCFATYFQEAPNYAFSLRENVSLSDAEEPGSDEMVMAALKKSKGDSIPLKTKAGLDAQLFRMLLSNSCDEALDLSGGEMQKIALARTLYRDRPIWVLDEPSSALDPESENSIYDTIAKPAPNRITILVSHRLSCAVGADLILVIKRGTLIEQGNHTALCLSSEK